MARLVYRAAARRGIAEIATYIQAQSKSRKVAENFVDKLTARCEALAQQPGLMGRVRPEFGRRRYRSFAYGDYVIFLRYADEDGPRSHLYVVHIVNGARDLDAYFKRQKEVDIDET